MALQSENRIIVGVGAVVFRGAEVLLVRRGRPPFVGKWSIPGGRVRLGERLEAAVRREVLEETGIEIEVGALIGAFESLPHQDDPAETRHFVMIDYLAEWRLGEPQAADDAADARFFPIEEALALVSWDKTRLALSRAAALRRDATMRL
jgi:8-oxo-dGTP diphosphatase